MRVKSSNTNKSKGINHYKNLFTIKLFNKTFTIENAFQFQQLYYDICVIDAEALLESFSRGASTI